MWKPEHRRLAERHGLRYPSDLTDAEWALVEPMIPPAKHGGRPRNVNIREVLNAIFYVLSTGCQWRALPKDLPPKSTAHFYFTRWDWGARWSASTTNCMSLCASRKAENRALTAAIVDSQSARAAQKATLRQGLEGKKVTGRKCHILVDTLGLLLSVAVHRFERYARTVAAFIRLAMIRLMLKRLTKPNLCLMNPFFFDRHLTALAS